MGKMLNLLFEKLLVAQHQLRLKEYLKRALKLLMVGLKSLDSLPLGVIQVNSF